MIHGSLRRLPEQDRRPGGLSRPAFLLPASRVGTNTSTPVGRALTSVDQTRGSMLLLFPLHVIG